MPAQAALLAGVGLQRLGLSELSGHLGLPYPQLLALFNKVPAQHHCTTSWRALFHITDAIASACTPCASVDLPLHPFARVNQHVTVPVSLLVTLRPSASRADDAAAVRAAAGGGGGRRGADAARALLGAGDGAPRGGPG